MHRLGFRASIGFRLPLSHMKTLKPPKPEATQHAIHCNAFEAGIRALLRIRELNHQGLGCKPQTLNPKPENAANSTADEEDRRLPLPRIGRRAQQLSLWITVSGFGFMGLRVLDSGLACQGPKCRFLSDLRM